MIDFSQREIHFLFEFLIIWDSTLANRAEFCDIIVILLILTLNVYYKLLILDSINGKLLEWNIKFKFETIVWMHLINWKYVWMQFKFMLNGLVIAIFELVIQSQVVTFVYETYNINFLKTYELHILC